MFKRISWRLTEISVNQTYRSIIVMVEEEKHHSLVIRSSRCGGSSVDRQCSYPIDRNHNVILFSKKQIELIYSPMKADNLINCIISTHVL